MSDRIEFGYCHCGCGQRTSTAQKTFPKRGIIKGFPNNFIESHNRNVVRRIDFSDAVPFKVDGEYCKLVPLTKGQFAIVLESRFHELNKFRWFANWNRVRSVAESEHHKEFSRSE